MIFFKVGSKDLTEFVDIQNYDMQEADIYQTWTDGNWVDHREIVRTRIQGTVKLGIRNAEDFSAFVALMVSEKQEAGHYPVTAYVSNTGATVTFDAFIDRKDEDKWDLVNRRQWQAQTLTVIER